MSSFQFFIFFSVCFSDIHRLTLWRLQWNHISCWNFLPPHVIFIKIKTQEIFCFFISDSVGGLRDLPLMDNNESLKEMKAFRRSRICDLCTREENFHMEHEFGIWVSYEVKCIKVISYLRRNYEWLTPHSRRHWHVMKFRIHSEWGRRNKFSLIAIGFFSSRCQIN